MSVFVSDQDRARVARMLRESCRRPATPTRKAARRPIASLVASATASRTDLGGDDRPSSSETISNDGEPDWLHAGRFGASAPLLAVHLGAGTPAKRWPIGHWDDLLGQFLRDGWRVVVVGGTDDSGLAATLTPHDELKDWTGRLAVTETTALLERADLFLGSDSGPAHLASCAGVPSVVLFSGTNRVGQWRPWSRRSLVLRHDVACNPCHRKVCPLADHPCMTALTPDRVYKATRRWWARLHRSESPHAPI